MTCLRNLSLFVNGVSDGSTASVSPMNDAVTMPLEVGRDPWRSSLVLYGNYARAYFIPQLTKPHGH